jgi:hypothetical protein
MNIIRQLSSAHYNNYLLFQENFTGSTIRKC